MTSLGDYLQLRNASSTSGVQGTQSSGGARRASGAAASNPSVFMGKTGATGGVGDNLSITGSSRTPEQIQAEIDELTKQKEANTTKINNLKSEIETLKSELEANKAEIQRKEQEAAQKRQQAAQKQQEAQQQQENAKNNFQQQSEQIAQAEIQKYNEANQNGQGMTKEELSANIAKALPQVAGLDNAQSAAQAATDLDSEADSLDIEISNLKTRNSDLSGQINVKELEVKDLEEENEAIDARLGELQEELANAQTQSSGNGQGGSNSAGTGDPIGFEVDGEMYEFIVDDGAFDETSDFLGYEDQWAAMEKLDADSNGTVDIKELQAGNIKLVNTKGEVADIEKLFGSEFSVDLNSYDKNGQYDIDSGDHDGDGIANQQLLGTFNVNLGNNKTVTGRNTLDDTKWLSEQFGIKNSSSSVSSPFGKVSSTNNAVDNSNTSNSNNIFSQTKQQSVKGEDASVARTEAEIEEIKNETITNAVNSVEEDDKNKDDDKKKLQTNPFGYFNN